MDAERLERGDVDLFHVSEMRNAAFGFAQALRDQPPDADHLDLFDVAIADGSHRSRRRLHSRFPRRLEGRFEVGLRDSTLCARPRDVRQIHARFARAASNRWRRQHVAVVGDRARRTLIVALADGRIDTPIDDGLRARGDRRRLFGGLCDCCNSGLRSRSLLRGRRRYCLHTRIGFEHDQYRTHRHEIARLAGRRQHGTGHRRRNFDVRFLGHHVDDHRILDDVIARLHVPLDDLGIDRAFAEIRQLELEAAHAEASITALSAAIKRACPGK